MSRNSLRLERSMVLICTMIHIVTKLALADINRTPALWKWKRKRWDFSRFINVKRIRQYWPHLGDRARLDLACSRNLDLGLISSLASPATTTVPPFLSLPENLYSMSNVLTPSDQHQNQVSIYMVSCQEIICARFDLQHKWLWSFFVFGFCSFVLCLFFGFDFFFCFIVVVFLFLIVVFFCCCCCFGCFFFFFFFGGGGCFLLFFFFCFVWGGGGASVAFSFLDFLGFYNFYICLRYRRRSG